MAERPVLFSGAMVRAILAGTKTQTRRIVQWRPVSPADVSATRPPDEAQPYTHIPGAWLATWEKDDGWQSSMPTVCPYGVPGDRLWVRETWQPLSPRSGEPIAGSIGGIPSAEMATAYAADFPQAPHSWGPWRPSIHMPRWASRITLEITDVRVERLTSITEEDARAEGITFEAAVAADGAVPAFRRLWDSINGKRPGCSWADNPWVWVVSFRRVEVAHG